MLPATSRNPFPRFRSRAGLIDDDGIPPKTKTGDDTKADTSPREVARIGDPRAEDNRGNGQRHAQPGEGRGTFPGRHRNDDRQNPGNRTGRRSDCSGAPFPQPCEQEHHSEGTRSSGRRAYDEVRS